ncbi:methyltransferase domain-containing protein [Limibacter armeniacum]|uniref:SAM-dependent methyltransferase n=1 Tax=Limibacter armeniacum TaxID=466084 RepID=UPI002FE60EB2
MASQKEWFDEWFNTPYYHILYKNRDYTEAQLFIDNLIAFLGISPEHKLLDLACGKGRHSIYLNHKGLDVEGIDLSEESINYAKQFENDRLHFSRHDMRIPYKHHYFDFVLNMFTSFGYFKTDHEDMFAIEAIAECLKDGGYLVLDYFNTYKVTNSLPIKEEIFRDEMKFDIHKYVDNGFVKKDISFQADGKQHLFTESVKALKRSDFQRYFEGTGLKVIHILGSYSLDKFDKETSDRMIFIVQKV